MKPLAGIGRTAARVIRAAGALGRAERGHRLLYIFSGNAPVWRPAAAALWPESAAFRAGIEAAAPVVERMLAIPAAALVAGEWQADTDEQAAAAEFVGMLLVQIGLVDLWRDRGVVVGGALGISVGEIAAAYSAGALGRGDAVVAGCAVVRRLDHRTVDGWVLMIEAPPEKAQRLARHAPRPLRFTGEVMPGVCAMESDRADGEALRPWLAGRAAIRDERPRRHRYHAGEAGFDEEAFGADIAAVAPRAPAVPLYLAGCGGRVPEGLPLDGGYWHWATTGPYRFAGAAAAAAADGFDRTAVFAPALLGDWYRAAAPRRLRVRTALPLHRTARSRQPWEEALAALSRTPLAPPEPPAAQPQTEIDPATLDLASPAIAADPFPAYEALRRLGPVHHLPRHDFWIVVGHGAMREACARPDAFSNRPYGFVDPVLIGADPPRHAAVRRLVAPYFAAEALARAERIAAATARDLLRPRFDLVGGYAAPIARTVAADLIGLDEATVEAIVATGEAAQGTADPFTAIVDGLAPLMRRADAWLRIRAAGEGLLDEAETISLVRFLWLAAITTTERVIVRAGMRLIADPSLRERVAADRTLVRPLVEEAMRLHPPEHMLPRVASAATELAGVAIPSHARVMLCTSAANRDPGTFEDPADLRLDRGASRHLSFGSGPHVCSGAALARRVIPAAMEALVAPPARLRALQPLPTVRWLATEMTLAPLELMVAT